MALPAARALRSYAHKALGSGPVSAAIPNARDVGLFLSCQQNSFGRNRQNDGGLCVAGA
jgi:hypothetical protein